MFDIKAKRFLTFYRHVLIAFLSNYLLFSAYDSFSCSSFFLSSKGKNSKPSFLLKLQMCLWSFLGLFFFLSFFFLSLCFFTQPLQLQNGAARLFPPLVCLSPPFSAKLPASARGQKCRERRADVRETQRNAWTVVITFRAFFREEREAKCGTPAAPSLTWLLPSDCSLLYYQPPSFFLFFESRTSFFLSFWLKKSQTKLLFLIFRFFYFCAKTATKLWKKVIMAKLISLNKVF